MTCMSDVYERVTGKIIALLEQGTCPWKQPWQGCAPTNISTGKEYRGINHLLLNCIGFESPYWLTFKQAQRLGGSIKAGEKSPAFVVFSDTYLSKKTLPDGTETTEPRWVLKYTPVFNITQAKGIDAPADTGSGRSALHPIEACEQFMADLRERPMIETGQMAAFLPGSDRIVIPALDRFKDVESYHSALFHELTHWSGAKHRLNRPQPQHSTDRPGYAREELVAEMGAAFLCAYCGIDTATAPDSASYIAGWLKALRNDRRLVIDASRSARVAEEWLQGA